MSRDTRSKSSGEIAQAAAAAKLLPNISNSIAQWVAVNGFLERRQLSYVLIAMLVIRPSGIMGKNTEDKA